MRRRFGMTGSKALPLICLAVLQSQMLLVGSASEKIVYARDVRPLLSNACFQCHGPDEDAREADLRLDRREGLFRKVEGVSIVAAGKPSQSELIRRILSHDPDEMMPPEAANKRLSEQQKRVLVEWVKQGAEWQDHWAFVRPERPAVPDDGQNAWCRNEIDAFILRRLRNAGLEPSEIAGPYTLVRRIYLDLIGLQPAPEEADRWVQRLSGQSGSNEPVAIDEAVWQDLITHLLASPQYGERWARRWLDLARYADTNGYEKDRDRSMWPWRDWVVSALNEGKPFDKFTIEQLAGDMLPDATVAQRVATGFHRNTMLNEEGGIDPLEFRFHAMTDRVATTGTTWLGLTLGCCQCHTHKYDPVSHHEYYELMALLNNADEPTLLLPDEDIETQWAQNRTQAEELRAGLADHWPVEDTTVVSSTLVRADADGQQDLRIEDSGFVVVSGPNPKTADYTVELELPSPEFDAIRLSTQASGSQRGPGRTDHGNFVLTGIRIQAAPKDDPAAFVPVDIASASATAEQDGFDVARSFDGNNDTGWGIHASGGVPKTATGTFQLKSESLSQLGNGPVRLQVVLQQRLGNGHTIGAFRIDAVRKRSEEEVRRLRAAAIETAFRAWHTREQEHAVAWHSLKPVRAEANLPILTIQDDDSIFASGDTAKRDDYDLTFAPLNAPTTALRLEALPDDRLPAGGPGSTYYEGTLGDFYLTEIRARAGETVFPFASASETYKRNRYGSNPVSAALALDGDVQTGWSVHDRQGERHVAVFLFEEPVPAGQAIEVRMTFGRHFASSLGRFRFSATSAPGRPQARTYSDDVAELLRMPFNSLSAEQRAQLRQEFLLRAPQLAKQAERIRRLRKRPSSVTTLVLSERPRGHERPTFRHHRGEYLQPKDSVDPGVPDVLSTGRRREVRSRLQFARWLVSGQNPLTARVVVNRHWQAFFGHGMVRTLEDFGLQGEAPSHPELLDWLAVTFVEQDQWSLKALHRRIVSSSVYRQQPAATEDALQKDPENRLLSRAARFRLDAEIVRDQILQAAGVLSVQLGGPPVRPLQPAGVSEVAYGSPKWNASQGDDRYRRSLYTYTKRTAPFAMFNTFDGPTGESCVARRNRSNSPLQALTLLNDVMMMDLARHAGRRAAAAVAETSREEQLDLTFRRMLVRPPKKAERVALLEFLNRQESLFVQNQKAARNLMNVQSNGGSEEDIAIQAAWTATARAIFGLDESLTRE